MNRSRYSGCAAAFVALIAAVGAGAGGSAAQAAPDAIEQACRSLGGADSGTVGLAKLLRCEGAGRRVLEDDASSALGSAGAVFECFGAGEVDRDELARPDVTHRARYAVCGAEARRLDRAAIERELDARKASPAVRKAVARALGQIEAFSAAMDAHLAPAVKGDRLLSDFYYKVPDRAFELGLKVLREGAEPLAAVREYEARAASRSPQAVAGCFEPLRARLIALLREKKVRTLDEVRYEMAGPVGYQLSRALESCASFDGHELASHLLSVELEGADDFRGPRTMVYWFLRDHLKKLAADRRELPVSVEELTRARVPVPAPPVRSFPGTPPVEFTARIKAMRREAKAVRLEFETITKREEEANCWDTNQVQMIRPSGDVVLRRKCGKSKMVTRRYTPKPVVVDAAYAAPLAKARTVRLFCNRAAERACVPLAVWKAPQKKKLVGILGADL